MLLESNEIAEDNERNKSEIRRIEKKKACNFIPILFMEIICCIMVLYVALWKDLSTQEVQVQITLQSFALIAMIGLAFFHGMISFHYVYFRPSMSVVTREKQPEAHAQRDFYKFVSIAAGICIQCVLILVFQPHLLPLPPTDDQ